MTHHPHLGDNGTRDHVYKSAAKGNTIFMDVNLTTLRIYGCNRAHEDMVQLEAFLEDTYPDMKILKKDYKTTAARLVRNRLRDQEGQLPKELPSIAKEREYVIHIPVDYANHHVPSGELVHSPHSPEYKELSPANRRANDVEWRKLRDNLAETIDEFLAGRGYDLKQKGTYFADRVQASTQAEPPSASR